MQIYLDYIFFENIIVNYLVLVQIEKFTKTKAKTLNKILAVFFISIYTVIIYLLKDKGINLIFVEVLVVCVYTYIAYFNITIIKFLKIQIYYYLISFLYVGIIICVSVVLNVNIENYFLKILVYIVSYIILTIFNKETWKMWKRNIKKVDLTYILKIGGQEIIAFLDTGNSAKDYISGLDVIFVSDRYFKEINRNNTLKEYTKIEFKTITGTYDKTGYLACDIEVIENTDSKEKTCRIPKIIVAFIDESVLKNKEYSAILGYNTYLENLRGVTLC